MKTFKIEKNETQCVVTWWYFSGAAVVLCGFLAYVTFFCVMITRELFVTQEGFWFIFAPLLWGVWCFLFAKAADEPFGKTRLVLHKGGLEIRWTWLFIRRKKRCNLADIRCFRKRTDRAYMTHAGFPLHGFISHSLRIVHQKGEISFRVPSSKEELTKLCNRLNAFLNKLKQRRDR